MSMVIDGIINLRNPFLGQVSAIQLTVYCHKVTIQHQIVKISKTAVSWRQTLESEEHFERSDRIIEEAQTLAADKESQVDGSKGAWVMDTKEKPVSISMNASWAWPMQCQARAGYDYTSSTMREWAH